MRMETCRIKKILSFVLLCLVLFCLPVMAVMQEMHAIRITSPEKTTSMPTPVVDRPSNNLSILRPPYSGRLPCFLGRFTSRLEASSSSAAITYFRVSRGSITSSTTPALAAESAPYWLA